MRTDPTRISYAQFSIEQETDDVCVDPVFSTVHNTFPSKFWSLFF